MWFDAQAELAKLGGCRESDTCPPATLATSATQCPVVAIVADVAAPPAESPEPEISRHGESVAGHPLTWTGRIVALDEWRRLTEWERHGPNGRLWCSISQSWEWFENGRLTPLWVKD